ncbi:MAG: hypothetical protein AVDCRST_MAG44-727 [uncultured Sphingomonas sp.]|uniref:General stress protein 17M-like domain-containing protein n=1 Tax=uncultured Sphingomonas sp. TaxID=158754 RepID=A0A6J4SPK7_9SPHN|nr:MAG: hypothetical protein AVDCRST_MAG44-727 [uncultured Sphingomonas sp.]
MSDRIASAVFDNREEAERALSELRSAGFREESVSIVGRSESGKVTDSSNDGDDDGVNKSGAVKGALGGAAAGTLLGVAALAIPGVGPLAAAGAIAAGAVPEAAAIGAAVGATAGGVSGLLAKHGVSDEDSKYYESRINDGGIFVSVDADRAGGSIDEAREILYRNGGHSSTRQRTTNS